MLDILCIFNRRRREEAQVDQHEELSDSGELYDLEAQVTEELDSESYNEEAQVDDEFVSTEPCDEESPVCQEGAEIELS